MMKTATAMSTYNNQIEKTPDQAELKKDVWDIRNLSFVRYLPHESRWLLTFTGVPPIFRESVKRFALYTLSLHTYSTCIAKIGHLGTFTTFFARLHPNATGFAALTRADMEAYFQYSRTTPMKNGKPSSPTHSWQAVHFVRHYLEYLIRASCPEAPIENLTKLVWWDDVRKQPKSCQNIKYIPASVLSQLDTHFHEMSANYLPVAIVLRASGWRIADVLNLRHNTCLEQTTLNGRAGWWLCGDISKTQTVNHRVPISDEVANVIKAQRLLVEKEFTPDENPKRYLFPSKRMQRLGWPLGANGFRDALNTLAANYNIVDDQGKVYHFNSHCFRHTKAVELINNGMSLIHVQKWMAHASPEMTMAYAQILDTTLRKSWEQAFAKGIFRLNAEGAAEIIDVSTETDLNRSDQIEWEYIRQNLDAVRLPDGYCFKAKKMPCPAQAIPCHTCRDFCTTPDFLPQFQAQHRDLMQRIEAGQQSGNSQWVERNSQLMEPLIRIIGVLESGKVHHIAGKSGREYPGKERSSEN